jgi:hypothetical protein
VIYGTCTSHCVFALDPTQFGSSTQHSVKVTVQDGAENKATTEKTFTLDGVPPTISITQKLGSSFGYPEQYWDVTFNDDLGLHWATITLNGTTIASQTWVYGKYIMSATMSDIKVSVTTLPEGSYPAVVTVADIFDNKTTRTETLINDLTPPSFCSLAVQQDPANPYHVYAALTGLDDMTGLSSLKITDSGGVTLLNQPTPSGPGEYRSIYLDKVLSGGKHTIMGTCTDRRGHSAYTDLFTLDLPPKCNDSVISGTNVADERTFEMGKTSGTVTIKYQTFDIHDWIRVYYQNALLVDLGCAATGDLTLGKVFSYSGSSSKLTVRVDPSCNPQTAADSTLWNYSLSCP